jgi:DNA-binding transcriptional ArsR family regulator
MNEIDALRSLAALSQATRLAIFRALVAAGPEGLRPIEVLASSLSFHLKELLHAQLITQQREGKFLIYRAEFARMNALLAYLTDNCCQGQPCVDLAALSCREC